ncbi:alpha/beta hydrolase family protein [Oryzifoliimicrobium ureilyticus]|uniref:alpha/beta hydrolase family protein n=1 Tax=Oryzifoliimicrobium ureilyticus TaxID=3113724 RepID=UPI00307611F1
MTSFLRAIAVFLVMASASPAWSIGFQYFSLPDDNGRPIEVGIWYPSASQEKQTTVGMISQTVALDGAVEGSGLPTVIFSHGNGGWYGDRSDSATLLAQHGFVAVSLTYPGDNYKDRSDGVRRQMTSRPIVTSQVLDYMLTSWSGRGHLDQSKIGFYGFSAGGYTGLLELGGVPDWTVFAEHCAEYQSEMTCSVGGANHLSSAQTATLTSSTWHHDPRIKAAVLVSPGYGFAFDPKSLRTIGVPIELWGGSLDENVPFASNVAYLKNYLPNVVAVHDVPNARHYSFLKPCSEALKAKSMETCSDAPGFDRAAFQRSLNEDLLAFFQKELLVKAQ